jgi:adenylylsulfate kinase-like enzyme
MVRELVGDREFIEIHMDTPLEVCEARDPKGLYKKARLGEIKNFTGIDSNYEAPEQPEVRINTAEMDVETCVEVIIDYLKQRQMIFSYIES